MSVRPVSGNQPVAVGQAGGRAAPTRSVPETPSKGASPAPGEAVSPAPEEIRRAAVEQAVEALRQHTSGALEFIVNDGLTIVKVVDRETNTVLRQIPSEEILEIRRAIERMQGILIRLKA